MNKNTNQMIDKLKNLEKEIQRLDNDILKNKLIQDFYSIVVGEYEQIDDWDDIFNIGDINDVKVDAILKNQTGDFSSEISDVIGESDYEKKTIYEKEMLNILFALMQDFISKHEKIFSDFSLDIKAFLQNYKSDFVKYVQSILKSSIE